MSFDSIEPLVRIENLSKSFGEKVIFEDWNCDIYPGEFVVLTGPSGCGKTTLLNMIGGLEPVSDGDIIVAGQNIATAKDLKTYYRDTVGFVFQNFALVDQKTVEDNLEMVHPKGMSEVSINDALVSVGMEGSEKQKVYTLSGGEQQRVSLARLRLKKCELILADEPTGSLDKDNGEIVMQILNELNQEGKTVIMVTHDESLIRPLDRTIRL